jgi:RNA polymerase primary sigma factor
MRASYSGAQAVERQPAQEAVSHDTERNDERTTEAAPAVGAALHGNLTDESGGAGDALRRYLREISGADLLTRDQEVALAQRIEAGRAVLFSALCRSPVFVAEIKGWRDRIKGGTLLLREIVDLASTGRGVKGAAALDEAEVADDSDNDGTASSLSRIEEELPPLFLLRSSGSAAAAPRLSRGSVRWCWMASPSTGSPAGCAS